MGSKLWQFVTDNIFSLISAMVLIQSIIGLYKRRQKIIRPKEMWRLPLLLSMVALLGYIQIGDYTVETALLHLGTIGIGAGVGYLRVVWSKLDFGLHDERGAVYFRNNVFGVASLAVLIVLKMVLKVVIPPTTGLSAVVAANYLISFSCGNMVGRRIYLLFQHGRFIR